MRAMEVLPILKEKVAFLSGEVMCVCLVSKMHHPLLSDHGK